MQLIVGLGNPGEKYKNIRHNVGFEIIDKIKKDWSFPEFVFYKKFNAEISESNYKIKTSNYKLILVKPQTFMNNSGQAVQTIMDFYKLTAEDILVIHDDLDIDLGEFKIATNSRSAGHRGVQDIIDKIGTQKFKRIRIGIGRNENMPSENYVLQRFTPEEKEKIGKISEKILEAIQKLL